MSEDDASENIHSALGYRRPGSYEELRADPHAWAEVEAERTAKSSTVADNSR